MAQLDNPNLNLADFNRGDFVEFLLPNKKHSFGIVIDTETNVNDIPFVNVTHYENGFPLGRSVDPRYGSIKKSTKDKALNHFNSVSESLKEKIKEGGLRGAIHARKQHQLSGVIDNLKLIPDPYAAIMADVQPPMTGLYVLMGIYSGQGYSDYLESLLAIPRLSESKVTDVLSEIKPNGFGNIPGEIWNTSATSHDNLVAMVAYEVPKHVTYLVSPKPTRTLEELNFVWRFSETFAKK